MLVETRMLGPVVNIPVRQYVLIVNINLWSSDFLWSPEHNCLPCVPNCCSGPAQVTIAEEGCIPAIVTLLRSSQDVPTQYHALMTLCRCDHNAEKVADLSASCREVAGVCSLYRFMTYVRALYRYMAGCARMIPRRSGRALPVLL